MSDGTRWAEGLLSHPRKRLLWLSSAVAIAAVAILWIVRVSYPLIDLDSYTHKVTYIPLEVIRVGVCFGVFIYGWSARRFNGTVESLVVSLGFLSAGLFLMFRMTSILSDTPPDSVEAYNQAAFFRLLATATPLFCLLVAAMVPHGSRMSHTAQYVWLTVAVVYTASEIAVLESWRSALPLIVEQDGGTTPVLAAMGLVFALCALYVAVAYSKSAIERDDNANSLISIGLLSWMVAEATYAFVETYTDAYRTVGNLVGAAAFVLIFLGFSSKALIQPHERLVKALDNLKKENARLAARDAQLAEHEKSLAMTRFSLQSVLRDSPVLFFTLDRNGRILFVGGKVASELGLLANSVVGKSVLKVYEGTPAVLDSIHQALKGAAVSGSFAQGDRVFEFFTVPNISASASLIGSSFLAVDVTARVRTEEKLRETVRKLTSANRDLSLFAHVVSNDLQEPLRMISSYLQLISKRYRGHTDQDTAEFIGYAVDSAKRLQKMIDDLLAFSRVNSGGKAFLKTDMNSVLDNVLANLQVAIAEKAALITSDPLPTIIADESQMMQLMRNLIENALKFKGDQPPRIHISAMHILDEWVFTIRDNGIGIDQPYHEKVFDVFPQLHPKGKYQGTGIGLATCKRIVERHGGRIWVESKPGWGSMFNFSIADKIEEMPADVSAAEAMPTPTWQLKK